MGSDKLKVVVGSKNPTKINAVKRAIKRVFKKNEITIEGFGVSSGVSDQPMSCLETKNGAINRVKNLENKDANLFVGIEGGCDYINDDLFAFAWVITKNNSGIVGKGKTSMFQLPKKIQKLIEMGVELGEADDIVFKRNNSKEKNGAVGILTNNLIDRTKYYEEAVVLSLIPFIKNELFI